MTMTLVAKLPIERYTQVLGLDSKRVVYDAILSPDTPELSYLSSSDSDHSLSSPFSPIVLSPSNIQKAVLPTYSFQELLSGGQQANNLNDVDDTAGFIPVPPNS